MYTICYVFKMDQSITNVEIKDKFKIMNKAQLFFHQKYLIVYFNVVGRDNIQDDSATVTLSDASTVQISISDAPDNFKSSQLVAKFYIFKDRSDYFLVNSHTTTPLEIEHSGHRTTVDPRGQTNQFGNPLIFYVDDQKCRLSWRQSN